MDVEDRVPTQTTKADDALAPGATTRLVTELRELGLSTYQARVLLALLWVESANSVQLATLSGVGRTSIYQVMNDLTQQGLTERLPSRGPAVWASVDREKVLDLLDAAGVERFSLHRARTRCLRRMLSALLTDDAPPSPREQTPAVDPPAG